MEPITDGVEEDRRHHQRDRRDRVPDQHPGAERRGGKAARAGEQGRGVCGGGDRGEEPGAEELRTRPRRSRGLIGDSAEKVEAGSKLVADAGTTMEEIVKSVKRVTDIMGRSRRRRWSRAGIEQVNQAVRRWTGDAAERGAGGGGAAGRRIDGVAGPGLPHCSVFRAKAASWRKPRRAGAKRPGRGTPCQRRLSTDGSRVRSGRKGQPDEWEEFDRSRRRQTIPPRWGGASGRHGRGFADRPMGGFWEIHECQRPGERIGDVGTCGNRGERPCWWPLRPAGIEFTSAEQAVCACWLARRRQRVRAARQEPLLVRRDAADMARRTGAVQGRSVDAGPRKRGSNRGPAWRKNRPTGPARRRAKLTPSASERNRDGRRQAGRHSRPAWRTDPTCPWTRRWIPTSDGCHGVPRCHRG